MIIYSIFDNVSREVFTDVENVDPADIDRLALEIAKRNGKSSKRMASLVNRLDEFYLTTDRDEEISNYKKDRNFRAAIHLLILSDFIRREISEHRSLSEINSLEIGEITPEQYEQVLASLFYEALEKMDNKWNYLAGFTEDWFVYFLYEVLVRGEKNFAKSILDTVSDDELWDSKLKQIWTKLVSSFG